MTSVAETACGGTVIRGRMSANAGTGIRSGMANTQQAKDGAGAGEKTGTATGNR